MSKQTEALKLALEALEYISSHYMSLPKVGCMALAAIEEALAERPAQQEPVAWITQGGKGWLRWHNKNDDHLNKTSVPLYKHPKRKPLSDAEIALISAECSLRTPSDIYFARAIEAAHGIKGGA